MSTTVFIRAWGQQVHMNETYGVRWSFVTKYSDSDQHGTAITFQSTTDYLVQCLIVHRTLQLRIVPQPNQCSVPPRASELRSNRTSRHMCTSVHDWPAENAFDTCMPRFTFGGHHNTAHKVNPTPSYAWCYAAITSSPPPAIRHSTPCMAKKLPGTPGEDERMRRIELQEWIKKENFDLNLGSFGSSQNGDEGGLHMDIYALLCTVRSFCAAGGFIYLELCASSFERVFGRPGGTGI